MFKLNFSKILSDFSLRKEKTDMFICTWKLKKKSMQISRNGLTVLKPVTYRCSLTCTR